ncbi:MAG TPA: beta-ketoacyl synthase chain length factor [Streptosporangiaceae bacterium]
MTAPPLARSAAAVTPGSPRRDELTVLARGRWPSGPGDVLPALPGFVISSFSPLAAAAAYRCLEDFFGSPPAPPGPAARTGVVLASASGDIATAVAVAGAVDAGRRVPPMLFYQSNPNAVVGYITARWGLAGPVICTCPAVDVLADARDSAALLVAEGDTDAVLVIAVSQDRGPGGADHAEAELLGPAAWRRASTEGPPG